MEDYSVKFLRGTINNTYDRCICLEEVVKALETPDDLNEYVSNIITILGNIKHELSDLLNDPNLGHEFLINQQYSRYYRHSQHLSLLESYPITILSRLNEDDQHFYKLTKIICNNINYPYRPPLVTTFCMTYYASELNTELLLVPFIDRNFLLDIPFILHELGHIILQKNEDNLIQDFLSDLRKYINGEKDRVKDDDRSPEYIELFNDLKIIWEESWSKEFTSDLIATYLLGPSYGWSYLKLCNRFSKNIYEPGKLDDILSEHPSHEARMRCIIEALKELQSDYDLLEQHWKEFTDSVKESPPQEYELCYPDHILKSLIKSVIKGCEEIGLTRYTENLKQDDKMNIIKIMKNSYEKFLENPSEYRKLEIETLDFIKDSINESQS